MPGLTSYDPTHGAQDLGKLWTLTKEDNRLVCSLWTHLMGWELGAVLGGDHARFQVCKTQGDVVTTVAAWKTAALAAGWTL